ESFAAINSPINVSHKQRAEEHDLGSEKNPHTKRCGVALLRLIFKLRCDRIMGIHHCIVSAPTDAASKNTRVISRYFSLTFFSIRRIAVRNSLAEIFFLNRSSSVNNTSWGPKYSVRDFNTRSTLGSDSAMERIPCRVASST